MTQIIALEATYSTFKGYFCLKSDLMINIMKPTLPLHELLTELDSQCQQVLLRLTWSVPEMKAVVNAVQRSSSMDACQCRAVSKRTPV